MKILRYCILDINSFGIKVNKKLISLVSLTAALALPLVAGAQTVQGVSCSVENLVKIIFGVAVVVYFLWYGIMFLTASGDATKVATARQGVLWGVVGIVVGGLAVVIVGVVTNFFGFGLNIFAC